MQVNVFLSETELLEKTDRPQTVLRRPRTSVRKWLNEVKPFSVGDTELKEPTHATLRDLMETTDDIQKNVNATG